MGGSEIGAFGAQVNLGTNVTAVGCIISPNHILFSPRWNIAPGDNGVDEYMGFMNHEWLRMYIWR